MNNKIPYRRVLLFLAVLFALLALLSGLSFLMTHGPKPILNHSTNSIYDEPDGSIDVISIGDSNVYSSISPLQMWEDCGISSYSCGEPAERISHTFEHLKNIYRHQTPKVVFIEGNCLFRDKSNGEVLESITKAKLGKIFPIVTYHSELQPDNLPALFRDGHSITRGYYMRAEVIGADPAELDKNRNETEKRQPVHPLNSWILSRCIRCCRDHGSQVVLLSVPSANNWNYKKHNKLMDLAKENKVPFLDMNLQEGCRIDWTRDSCDGGDHLNIYGAQKATSCFEDYLLHHYQLPDHRKDKSYAQWNKDLAIYHEALSQPQKLIIK